MKTWVVLIISNWVLEYLSIILNLHILNIYILNILFRNISLFRV